MLPSALHLTPEHARRFHRRALLLDTPAPDVASAIAHLGYIHIDPLNICGRMHDLILRARVAGYREGGLFHHVHGSTEADPAPPSPPATHPTTKATSRPAAANPGTGGAERARLLPGSARTAFEHHHPETGILVAFGLEAWPHLQAAMRRRSRSQGSWSGRLTSTQEKLGDRLLAEITARGPLSAEDFAETGRARLGWGSATQAKATLQKLFFHGRLLIAHRDPNNRRHYDLPARLLPAQSLATPAADPADTARWCAILKLRQRRLVTLKRTELPLVADLVQPVRVDGCPPLYCLRSDQPLLDLAASRPPLETARFLAPLEPLIYDRRVTSALWGFDYTWEAYTPPARRVRGHYSLPILAGAAIVGHIDPRADRAAGRLRVAGRSVRRGHRIADEFRELARWLGLR